MKKICLVLLLASSLLATTACGQTSPSVSSQSSVVSLEESSTPESSTAELASSDVVSDTSEQEELETKYSEIKLYAPDDLANGTTVKVGEEFDGWILEGIFYYDDTKPTYTEYSFRIAPIEKTVFTGTVTCQDWYGDTVAYLITLPLETVSQFPVADPNKATPDTEFLIQYDFTEEEIAQLGLAVGETATATINADSVLLFQADMGAISGIRTSDLIEIVK